MPENETEPAGHTMFPALNVAGDVQSNSETINALREGVTMASRLAAIVIEDSHGDEHRLPIAVMNDAEGETSVVVLERALQIADERAAGPRRRIGNTTISDLASLIAFTKRFRTRDTVAFAVGGVGPLVQVVFDYHEATLPDFPLVAGGGAPGWALDRALYKCPLSRQWTTWTGWDGKAMSQVAFGDLIELHADDLIVGEGHADATTMLAVARNLVIYDKGVVKREVNPTDGTGTLTVTTEHDSKSTKIPRSFLLGIPVFEGSTQVYPVEARMRFSLDKNTGAASFGFILHNRAQVYDHALAELREVFSKETGIPVFLGTP